MLFRIFTKIYRIRAALGAAHSTHTERETYTHIAQRREQTTCRHVTNFVCVCGLCQYPIRVNRIAANRFNFRCCEYKLYITRQEEKVAITATIGVVATIAVHRRRLYYIFVCLQRDCRTIWLLTKIFTFLTWINLFKPPFVHNNNNTWESSRYTHTQFEYFALHIFSVLCLHFFLYWQPCNVCVSMWHFEWIYSS